MQALSLYSRDNPNVKNPVWWRTFMSIILSRADFIMELICISLTRKGKSFCAPFSSFLLFRTIPFNIFLFTFSYQELMKESSRMPLFDLRKLNASLPVPSVPKSSIEILVLGAKDDFIVVSSDFNVSYSNRLIVSSNDVTKPTRCWNKMHVFSGSLTQLYRRQVLKNLTY